MYTPTIEQLNATQIGINISLSANAGAGKTSVLVDRYMKLLDTGVGINEIAAITFTKKAANEMIERISYKLDGLIAQPNLNKSELYKYKILRKQLSIANISTIHSFCINILKDYVIEADLEPNFRELVDFEKHKIIEDAIDVVLENIIHSDYDNDEFVVDNHYKDKLFIYYKRNEIISILKLIVNKPDLEEVLADISNISFDEWNSRIKLAFYEQTKDVVDNFIKYIDLASDVFDEINFKPNELKSNIYYLLSALINDKHNVTFDNYDKIVGLILDISNAKYTSNRFFVPAILKKYFGEELFSVQFNGKIELYSSSDYRKEIVNILGVNATNSQFSNIHFELNKVIFEIFKKVKKEINIAKKTLNVIDFDDILIKTRDLLVNNKDIAFMISNNFKEIMVDEFQDTNRIQYDIVKALVPTIDSNVELTQSEAKQYPNVFIVGDIKQSIYRFRNADVEVFAEAIKNIEKNNKKYFESKTKKYNYGTLALTTTFRTLPVITEFVNKVCKSLGLYGDSEENIHELICGRDNVRFKTEIAENQKLGEEYGSVNFLITTIDNKKDIAEDDVNSENNLVEESENEAKLIAQKIIEVVDASNNDYKYGDFAILYRSRTNINKLKTVFNEQNIPFIEQGSDGFWNTPEITHILNYLNFINNPIDDLACIGVLVSPFFAVSDSDLLYIQCSNQDSVWENLNNCLKNLDDTHSFRNIVETLQEHIWLASSISITHLIHIILSNPNWIERLELLKTEQAKDVVLNNIEKFVNKARDFQSRGYLSLNDFLLEINMLKAIDATDTGTVEEADINAVKLLTIHSSKGLEFKNVILYNLSASNHKTILPIINKKFGMGMNIPDDGTWRKMEKSFADNIIINAEKTEEYKESLRLLYVAMTRAKDHLYLSGVIKLNGDKTSSYGKNSIFSKIINAIGYNFEDISKLCHNNNCNEILMRHTIKILDREPIEAYIPLNLYTYADDMIIASKYNVNNEKLDKLEVLPNYNFGESNKILSFSMLSISGGADEYISNTLKIKIDNEYLDRSYNKNSLSGIKKGLLYHNIMEKFREWFIDGNIDKQYISSLIIKYLNINFNNNYNFIDGTISNIEQLVASDLIQRYKSALIEAQFEYEVYLPFKDNYLFGIIDCLIKNENDEYEIWDWKTNIISTIEELKIKYELQMLIYIYLLMYLYPKQNKYIARLISTELIKSNTEQDKWVLTIEKTNSDKYDIECRIAEMINNTLVTIGNIAI